MKNAFLLIATLATGSAWAQCNLDGGHCGRPKLPLIKAQVNCRYQNVVTGAETSIDYTTRKSTENGLFLTRTNTSGSGKKLRIKSVELNASASVLPVDLGIRFNAILGTHALGNANLRASEVLVKEFQGQLGRGIQRYRITGDFQQTFTVAKPTAKLPILLNENALLFTALEENGVSYEKGKEHVSRGVAETFGARGSLLESATVTQGNVDCLVEAQRID